MSAIEGRKVFADYYRDKKKLITPDPHVQKALVGTFQAFAKFWSEEQATLQLEGKEIKIADLKVKEIKLFAHFAKEFFKKNSMKESDAQAIQDVFLQTRRTCRNQFKYNSEFSAWVFEWERDRLDAQFSSMEKNLFLNETVEEAEGSGVAKETEAKIVELLKKEQASAKERVSKGKALRKRGALFMAASASFFVMGIVSIPIATIVTPLFIPAFFILMILTVTLGTITLWRSFTDFDVGGGLLKTENEEERFKELERYRTIVREPEYEAFVKEHETRYGSILQDPNQLSSFIELYKKEKKYKESYLATENLAKAIGGENIESLSKRLAIKVLPDFRIALEKLEYQKQEIQKRRKELELS